MKIGPFTSAKTIKIIAAIGAILAALTFLASALSGMLIFKLIRYLNTAQKALPKIEKAAQLYLESNTNSKKEKD